MRTCVHGDILELKSLEDFKRYEKIDLELN